MAKEEAIAVEGKIIERLRNSRFRVELDGGHHIEDSQEKKDHERQLYIENLGYTVLRFYNNDIDNNFSGVMEKIREACEKK